MAGLLHKERVKVWNNDASGERVLEGVATLTEKINDGENGDETWMVRFDGEVDTWRRIVHPEDLVRE